MKTINPGPDCECDNCRIHYIKGNDPSPQQAAGIEPGLTEEQKERLEKWVRGESRLSSEEFLSHELSLARKEAEQRVWKHIQDMHDKYDDALDFAIELEHTLLSHPQDMTGEDTPKE